MRNKHPFLQKVSAFIVRHDLLSLQGKYLVALSGGADSMALLKSLFMLHYNVEAVHCNFHLRGEESDRDEAFCRQQCEELGVRLHVAHFATEEYATAHQVSIEMAARDLRYDYFERLRVDIGADDVVVAHHRDDSVETVLINLIRGTGLHGLRGISPRRQHIIRPLLCVGRKEILGFLHDQGMTYVTDSTNLKDDIIRNKIRLDILPLMEEINPSVTDAIASTAERLRSAAEIFDQAVADRIARAEICSDGLDGGIYSLDQVTEEYTLFHILSPYGFSPSMIEDVFKASRNARTGMVFRSDSHELLFDRGKMIIQRILPEVKPYKIPETGTYCLANKCRLRIGPVALEKVVFSRENQDTVFVDAAKVSFPLTLRTVRPGDRIHPLGMHGSRLVSDILTDLKMNLFDKRRQLVIEDGQGEIIWLVGQRYNRHFRISPETEKALRIDFE